MASVSAPIDLAEAAFRLMAPRNRFYHWHIMRKLRRENETLKKENEFLKKVSAYFAKSQE